MSIWARGSVLALVLMGCGGETGELDDRDANDEDASRAVDAVLDHERARTPPPPPVAPVAPSSIDWYTDDALGLDVARRRGAPRVIVFGAQWCAACRLVDAMFRLEEVRREVARFVAVSIDATEDDPAVWAVLGKYAAMALPLVLVFDSTGKEVFRTTSLLDASDVASRLHSVR